MIKLFILLSLISVGHSQTLEECKQQCSLYGDGKGHDSVSLSCLNLFKSMASSNQVKLSDSGMTKVYGVEGILIFEKTSDSSLLYTTGEQAKLDHISAISIDEDNKEVAILDNQTGEVAFYSSFITGNIAPLRVIKSNNFQAAHDLIIVGDNVSILNGDNGQLWTYSRLADSNRRAEKRADAVESQRNDIPIGTTSLVLGNDDKIEFKQESKREIASEEE